MTYRRDPDRDPLTAYDDEPTIEGGVHHPYTAFNQGHDAFHANHTEKHCPYTDRRRRSMWIDGFRTAKRQAKKRHPLAAMGIAEPPDFS